MTKMTKIADSAAMRVSIPTLPLEGRVVGSTRFLTIRSYFDRGLPDAVEIGGTWLAASAQRTPINTEAKLLMLTHAFETWGVVRVDLKTDARNARSRVTFVSSEHVPDFASDRPL